MNLLRRESFIAVIALVSEGSGESPYNNISQPGGGGFLFIMIIVMIIIIIIIIRIIIRIIIMIIYTVDSTDKIRILRTTWMMMMMIKLKSLFIFAKN